MSILIQTFIAGAGMSVVLIGVRAAFRKRSASERHAVSVMAFVSLLAFPMFVAVLPEWKVIPLRGNTPVDVGDTDNTARSSPPPTGFQNPSVLVSAETVQSNVASTHATGMTPPASNHSTWQINWSTVLFGIWGTVAALLALRLVASFLYLKRLARRIPESNRGIAFDIFESVRERMSLREKVQLRLAPYRIMPMTWAFGIGYVMLPSDAEAWDRDHLESVIRHELEHIRRRDCWTGLLVQIVCALHWFNPFIWLCARHTFSDAEQACDDGVLRTGIRSSSYANHLLVTATRDVHAHPPVAALAMAKGTSIEKRIHTILDERNSRMPMSRLNKTLFAVFAIVLVSLGAVLRAAPADTTAGERNVTAPKQGSGQPGDSSDSNDATFSAEQTAEAKKHPAYDTFYRADTVVIGTLSSRLDSILESFPPQYGYSITVHSQEVLRLSDNKTLSWRQIQRQQQAPKLPKGKCVVAIVRGESPIVKKLDETTEQVARIAVQQQKADARTELRLAQNSPKKHPLYKKLKDKKGVAILRHSAASGVSVFPDNVEYYQCCVDLSFAGPLKKETSQRLLFKPNLKQPVDGKPFIAVYEMTTAGPKVIEVILADEASILVLAELYKQDVRELRKIVAKQLKQDPRAPKAKETDPFDPNPNGVEGEESDAFGGFELSGQVKLHTKLEFNGSHWIRN